MEEKTPRGSEGDPLQRKKRKKIEMGRENSGFCLI
jgi:hypothetical protein